MSSTTPRFSMAHNPVYQIDFSAIESGKRVAASKRRVRFRFGFSNAEAISEGATGTACRGEEHEVTLVWSLTSGKRLVLADGHEVHFSKGSLQQTKFDTTWTMRGSHTVKIVAHAAPPLFNTPGFRQFELFIDGMSFFEMPRIYELGMSKKGSSVVPYRGSSSSSSGAAYNNYSLPPQEEEYYREQLSSHEQRRQMDRGFSHQESSVSSAPTFARPPAADSPAADLMSDPTPVNEMQDHLAAPVALIDQQTVATAPTVTQTAPAYDEFAPVAPAPPSLASVHTEILGAYGPTPEQPAFPALAAEPHTQGVPPPPQQPPAYAAPAPMVTPNTAGGPPPPVQVPTYTYAPPANLVSPVSELSTPSNFQTTPPAHAAAPVVPPQEAPVAKQQLTMMQYTDPAAVDQEEADPSDVGQALKNLVNLDDINEDPNTPEKIKEAAQKRLEEEQMAKKKSKPMPPTVGSWHLGPKPSLGDIKETAPPKAPPKVEVMKTHAFDPAAAQAGMMVVYGQTMPQQHQQYHHHSNIGGMGFGMAQPAPAIGAYVPSPAY